MSATVNFLASAPGISYQTRFSGTFTADSNGLISGVPVGTAVQDLIAEGAIPLAANPIANPRDFVDCGDFSVNPFQRNIPGLASGNVISTAISNTPTYFADRFSMVGGASSAILASIITDTTLPGYNQHLKMQRQAANTNTAPIYIQHVLESLDCYRAQSETMTLSFYARIGANYSGGALTVQLASGTGVNQSAALLNSGSWTGQTNVINVSQAFSSQFTRYQFTGLVPANCSQLGIQISYTPSGTAGADDSVTFQDFQLEIGASASPPERLDAQITLEIAQRFAYVIPEPANSVIVSPGSTLAANSQTFSLPTPVQLIKAPTVTLATGSFKVAAGAAGATSTITAGSTHTPNMFSVNSTLTASQGWGALLMGGGGSGWIVASADF